MPLLVHTIEAAETQPDHTSVLVKAHVAAVDNDWAAGPLLRILPLFVYSDRLMDIKEFKTFGNVIHSSLLLVALRLLIWSEVLPPALAGVLWEGWGLHF